MKTLMAMMTAVFSALPAMIRAADLCCPAPPVPVPPAVEKTVDASPEAAAEATPGQWRGEDVFVYQGGDWMLEIAYLGRGTRSEGQHGRLFKDGGEVAGEKNGRTLETPFGMLRYYGAERRQRWDITGWNFAERRKIRRSETLPANPAPKPPEVAPES